MPTDEISAAWSQLPNGTIDIMPMSLKTGMIFLRAPPPTPTDSGFAIDGSSTTNQSTSHSRSYDDGSPLVYDMDSPGPDVVAFKALEESTDTIHPVKGFPGCPTQQDEEAQETNKDAGENSLLSQDSASVVSDPESILSSPSESPIPATKFHEMVDRGIADYRGRGLDPFVESIVISGVETIQSASLVSNSAHAIIKKITKASYMEGKRLEKALRVAAMEMFRQHWKPDGDWVEVSSTSPNHSSLTLRGVNKAGFMGSLFNARVATAEDIALCLSLLLEGDKHFDRLCAMHAVLIQANDKLCKSRNLPALMHLKENITTKDPESGEYVWATSPHSDAILKDMLDTIEGWVASQALKRVRYRASAMNRIIPRSAIGPRLRSGAEQYN
ncbi:hypothetical protein PAXRUDRAFT_10515 [Paxillus rubicundulus Ve08.2h10]|uniref:Uncharacterized protein n=1 Tax=Paxillus rubicundulus Ve08.2h10 TaxID=930991 RepID=A0A0D0EAV7_9AGAM|nr:hypothetical protein PAXRUDRAFT_10515 [Paxillus rubicundulus Ve08.2h10]